MRSKMMIDEDYIISIPSYKRVEILKSNTLNECKGVSILLTPF